MRLCVMNGAAGLALLCAVVVHAAEDPAEILARAPRWEGRSPTLVGGMFDVTFDANGTFAGFIKRDAGPGAASGATPSEVRGRWRVIGSQFSLEFPLTLYGHTSPTQVRIELVKVSSDLIQGLDQFRRPWEWRSLR